MSATQLNSRLLSDPHWKEVSCLLSDESRVSVYYLEELWGDDGFRQEWVRLLERFNAQWRGQVQEVVQRAAAGDMSLLQACSAGVVEGVSRLAEVYPLPFRVGVLLSYLLLSGLLKPLGVPLELQCAGLFGLRAEPKATQLAKLNTFFALSETLQLPSNLQEYLPAQLGVLLVAWELAFQNVDMCPPLAWLPLPLRSESKRAYLARVKNLLRMDAPLLREFVGRFCLKGSKYAWFDPRTAPKAILALAEDYYEKCAAGQRPQVSNRSEETLALYARLAYLRVVQKMSWSDIAEKVNLSRSAVAGSTPKAIDLLGIRR